jgi:hypothetical protein
MSNQRPPGGLDEPTQDPDHDRPGASPKGPASPQPWVDPNRTQRYSGRRSIVDRLKDQSKEPERLVTEETAPPPPKPGPARPQVASSAQMRVARGHRAGGGLRLGLVLVAVIVVGLAGGAGAAWFSGWRPSFLGSPSGEPAKTPEPKPAQPTETKPEVKPGEPTTPTPASPPTAEIPKSCFSGTSEVKAGAAACGFALDASGALSFQGARIAERVAAGNVQRLVLYPFSPSGRFVFFRACEAASGGRCEAQRLVDTKEKKLFEVKTGEAFAWVAWSPKETMGLLGWRENLSDTIAAVTTADGKVVRPSMIRNAKNRYSLVRFGSVRWRDEESFSVEVKQCPPGKGRGRNADCEKDDDVKYRRRTVKVER